MSHAAPSHIPTGIFEQSGLGLALLDSERRLDWINPTLARLVDADASSLMGVTPGDLPESLATLLFGKSELVHLHHAGDERWFRRETLEQADTTLLVFLDVSELQRLEKENRRLRQQVEDLKLNDDLTGLPNKRAITQALDLQISRSRRYQNPLSVVMVHIGLADSQIHALKSGTDPLVLATSRFLRDRLRWVDQIGRWEDNIFVLVLPETGQQDTDGLVEKISNEQTNMPLPEGLEELRPTLSFGTAYWQKGDDMRALLRRATDELAAA